MIFEPPLHKACLLRRYKRFLADIELPSGKQITVHCPNTGSMKHCIVEGSDCWYSSSENPKRKYPFTWEIASTQSGHLAGINTTRANALVKEALQANLIKELSAYDTIKSEVKYGSESSRIDFLLSGTYRPNCYVEVKNVTLGVGDGLGLFPDAVSERGTKHLRELITMAQKGARAVLIFCVQHTGIDRVAPADDIDPTYGKALRQAISEGVEVLAYRCKLSTKEIAVEQRIECCYPGLGATQ